MNKKAYKKGARAEYRAKKELEEQGWLVTRAAGSHGPFDLVAIQIRLIQIKATANPKAWTAELEELRGQLVASTGISRELWVWIDGNGWEYYDCDEGG